MPMSHKEANNELSLFEDFAAADKVYAKTYGHGELRVFFDPTYLRYSYYWNAKEVEKHLALACVRTFGEAPSR